MATPLPSYLKAYRQRSGLTQTELAALLGFDAPVNISRYERGIREPHLEAALALELLFDARTIDLFPKYTEEIIADLIVRVQRLEESTGNGTKPKDLQKKAALADMLTRLKGLRGYRS